MSKYNLTKEDYEAFHKVLLAMTEEYGSVTIKTTFNNSTDYGHGVITHEPFEFDNSILEIDSDYIFQFNSLQTQLDKNELKHTSEFMWKQYETE